MSFSQSHSHTRMVAARTYSITNTNPAMIWQTKEQRNKHDHADHGQGRRDDRTRPSRDDRRGAADNYGKRGNSKSHKEESFCGRRKGRSFSSFSRGRSWSPRKTGQPGPGILKGRSSTNDGR